MVLAPTGPPLNLVIMVLRILLSMESSPRLSILRASSAYLAIFRSICPSPTTCAKSLTLRRRELAIRGVPLLRNATLYWRQKQRETRSHFFGDLAEQGLDEIWNAPDYADFRRRVRNFEFSPCYRCSLCENWEQGLTDCYGNDAPTCGGCLWSEGVISCP